MLAVETRGLNNPRTYDAAGIAFHSDGQTIIKERLYLNKADPNKLYDEITVTDNALKRPWSALKTYRRVTAQGRSGGARTSAPKTMSTSSSAMRITS
jgi:hypothetical protein